MTIAEIAHKYEVLGVQLWVEKGQLRFRAPSGVLNEQRLAELRFYKASLIQYIQAMDHSTVLADPAHGYAPFPLTDIQAAYLIGRKEDYEFGGVGCHGYVELTMPVLDPDLLEQAWHSVIQRHDMLRAVISTKGYQQVLSDIALPPLRTQDLRGKSLPQVQKAIENVRGELSTRQYTPDQWPLYELFLTTTAEKSVVHFSIDMLIADFVSIRVMLAELDHFYHYPEQPLPKLAVTYRDLVLFQQLQQKQSVQRSQREADRQYWLERIDQLPEAPQLPMAEKTKNMGKGSFERHGFRLAKNKWDSICKQAKEQKITSSSAVLAAFAEVIGLWSGQSEFCINITILNRPELHPQVDQIVGDFTAVNVLEVAPQAGSSFLERMQALQKRLWLDLEHGSFTGIEVLRELRRRRNKSVIIPIVYTSMIGAGDARQPEGEFMSGARLTYGISQTPQVWIDCQVSEEAGELQLNWDVRRGIFPEGLIAEVLELFKQLLIQMADCRKIWKEKQTLSLPSHIKSTGRFVNNLARSNLENVLQDAFCHSFQSCADVPALCSEGRQFSYQELAEYAFAVQQALLHKGCQKGDMVGVVLGEGVWQVAALLGILLAGATYFPIAISQSSAQCEAILQDSGARLVLTHGEFTKEQWKPTISLIKVEELQLKAGC